jgi:hypothetical protein
MSEPWAQPTPLRVAEGHSLLGRLAGRLSPLEREMRMNAFEQARQAMDRFALAGGAPSEPRPLKKSYYPRPRRADRRVDVEVWSGSAFVP